MARFAGRISCAPSGDFQTVAAPQISVIVTVIAPS